jgi:2-hydroxychromene-2-carboxylate isomerase
MRGCLLLEPNGKLVPFARAVFEAYWGEDEDISQDAVLARMCDRIEVDSRYLFDGIGEQRIKDKLRANTESAAGASAPPPCLSAPTCISATTDWRWCAMPWRLRGPLIP